MPGWTLKENAGGSIESAWLDIERECRWKYRKWSHDGGKVCWGFIWFKSISMMEVNEQEILASRLEDGIASRLTALAFMVVMGFFCSANTLKNVDCRDIV